MHETLQTIVISVIGSGALAALISGIFSLVLNRKGRLAKIEGTLDMITEKLIMTEKNVLRTQLLLLLSDYPEERQEIMKLAEHYFKDQHGNWYMTSLFNTWLIKNNIARPEWFNAND